MRTNPFLFSGRIIIPYQFPNGRDGYVDYSLRTNTVAILTSKGEYIQDCPIRMDYVGLNDGSGTSLDYPKTELELGGDVLLLRMTRTSKPIVLGMMSKKGGIFGLSEEHQVLITRSNEVVDDSMDGERSAFTIEGKGLSGIINLLVRSEKQDGGKISIAAHNTSDEGEVNLSADVLRFISNQDRIEEVGNDYMLRVFNDYMVAVDGDYSTDIEGDYSNLVTGDWTTTVDGDAELEANEIKLGNGAQQWALKGEDTTDLIEDFIGLTDDIATALSSVVIVAPTGGGTCVVSPAFIAQMQLVSGQLQALSGQLQALLSQKVKIE